MKNLLKALGLLLILVVISCKTQKVKPTCTTDVRVDTIFRIREKIIHDTITNTNIVEKIVEKEVIKYVDRVVEKIVVKTDTIVKTKYDTITRYETIYLEDNTKIILLTTQLDSIKKVNTELTNSNNTLTNRLTWLTWWLVLALILGSGLSYYLYRQNQQLN